MVCLVNSCLSDLSCQQQSQGGWWFVLSTAVPRWVMVCLVNCCPKVAGCLLIASSSVSSLFCTSLYRQSVCSLILSVSSLSVLYFSLSAVCSVLLCQQSVCSVLLSVSSLSVLYFSLSAVCSVLLCQQSVCSVVLSVSSLSALHLLLFCLSPVSLPPFAVVVRVDCAC